MWILSLVPDNWLHLAIVAVLFSGIGLYAFSFFLNLFPAAKPYRIAIQALGSLMAILGVYFFGAYSTEMEWRGKVAEAEAKVAIAEQKSKETNTVIQKVYVDKVKVVKEVQVKIEERIIEKEKIIDAECKVSPDALSILNDAAKRPQVKK